MDIFVEQSINNQNIDKRKKIDLILRCVRYLCVFIIIALFVLFMISPIATDGGIIDVVINAVIYFSLMIPFIVLIIFLRRYVANKNAEYDYFIIGSTFRIVKVLNRTKRKLLVETQCSSIESVGRVNADVHEKLISDSAVKKVFAFCDYKDEDELVYVYYTDNLGKFIVYMTPNETMLTGIRRSVSRITVLDKSLTAYGKKE